MVRCSLRQSVLQFPTVLLHNSGWLTHLSIVFLVQFTFEVGDAPIVMALKACENYYGSGNCANSTCGPNASSRFVYWMKKAVRSQCSSAAP